MIVFFSTIAATGTYAETLQTEIPMRASAASTYYVDGHLNEFFAVSFMVDTGSSYTVINQKALAALEQRGGTTYMRDLTGIMADGSRRTVPIYRLDGMRIGEGCFLPDIEVAIFPGATRNILGISALRLAAPFIFSVDPPSLALSNCGTIPLRETDTENVNREAESKPEQAA